MVTEDGPPDKIIPFILLKSLNVSSFLGVIINEKTLNSLILLAISFITCDPKSTIIIFSLNFLKFLICGKHLLFEIF